MTEISVNIPQLSHSAGGCGRWSTENPGKFAEISEKSATAEKCSKLTQNESPAFAPVSLRVPSEQETRVRIPLKSLERLCGGLCEK
jgi:hypothetical protein